MKKIRLFVFILLCGVFLINCSKQDKEPQNIKSTSVEPSLKKVKLRLTWLHQSSYVPFHVAQEKGFYKKVGLDVEILPSGPDLRPIASVAGGSEEFGIEGAASILQAAANNVPIVVIATYLQESPVVFMARKSDHLADIKDWKGKRIGVWIGTHVESTFYAMLKNAGMTKKDVEIVPAKFDIAPFLDTGKGRVPIWNAYIYNEAQIPIEKGIDIDIVKPASVGVKQVGEGIFTSEKYFKEHPETVKAFIEGTIEGINYTADHQDEAIEILTSGKYGTGFDIPHQKNMLKAVIPLIKPEGVKVLSTNIDLWKETLQTAFPDGNVKPVDFNKLIPSH